MASYYAEIDNNNMVTQVIAVADASVYNANGTDNEAAGIAFCQEHYGQSTRWLHTRYDGSSRGHYASIGDMWRDDLQIFVSPQPYPSWSLNTATGFYVSPVPYPASGEAYHWDETLQDWVAD